VGFILTQLYPHDRSKLLEARAQIEKALEIQPQFFEVRNALNQLDEHLGLDAK